MTDTVRFFSCLQTGLSTALTAQADEYGVPQGAVASVEPKLRIAGINRDFSQQMALRGPGDVMRMDPAAITAVEPKPQDRDVEPNFFPYVELSDATLPWMFTPALPNAGRLMPWLVLVVVPKSDEVSLTRLASAPGMVLSISGGAGIMLPLLTEAYAWAHVEDRSGAADPAAAFAARPSDFIARLMCPLNMARNAAYIAAVVPAFEAGRQAGLGREVTETSGALAWSPETEALDLPVYYHWEFSTGGDDFETLVRKLRGIPVDDTVGLHDLDITRPRGGLDIDQVMGKRYAEKRIIVSYRGALTSPVANPRPWPKQHAEPFQDALHKSLTPEVKRPKDRAQYVANDHDPVITAPVYSSFQKDRELFKKKTARWMTEANLDPQYRANAGLGARTVRRHQENLMGKAWARAKGVEEVQTHLRHTRVALGVSIEVHARLSRLPAPQYLQMTTAIQPNVETRGGGMTVADQLRDSPSLADGVLSATFRRNAVTTQVRVKALPQSPKTASTLQFEATKTTLSGKVATFEDRLPALDVGAKVHQVYSFGGKTLRPSMSLDTLATSVGLNLTPVKGTVRGTTLRTPALQRDPKSERKITGILGKMTVQPQVVSKISRSVVATNTNSVKQTIQQATKPTKVLPDLVLPRIEGLAKPPTKRVEIPPKAQITVSFEEPAYEFLRKKGAEFLLPGFGGIAEHSVSLLVTNSAFVESYLLGLNHETSREFAWRQFPAALDSTWFRRFWDYLGETPKYDISPIKQWQNRRKLGAGTSENDAVVLVKSPLFKRYPDTLVYAVPAKWVPIRDLEPEELAELKRTKAIAANKKVRLANFERKQDILTPSFSGKIGGSASFFGFSTDPLSLVGTPTPEKGTGDPGYFIVFEQAATNQKFGLDQAQNFTPNRAPSSADDLSWGHFATSQEDLDQRPFAELEPGWQTTAIDGAFWGKTSADTAKLAPQSPVRIMFHASGLMDIEGLGR